MSSNPHPPGSREWLQFEVDEFVQSELSNYEKYSEFLEKVLNKACKMFGIYGIVQTRPKSISSFAEKCLRKAYKYKHPVRQLTDLCGARVIATTQAEVQTICRFIEDAFDVDKGNSLDVKTRLKSQEFGYLSIHYVVEVKKGIHDILGIEIPPQIRGRRAEIQVRTLLEHAWAAISHDRVYKSDFDPPETWKRELAALAAMLENADNAFSRIVEGIEAFKVDFGAYMSEDDITREIMKWEAALDQDWTDAKLAHKIARLAIAIDDWKKAQSVLQPFIDSKSTFILHDLGLVHCLKACDPAMDKCDCLSKGREYLETVVKLNPTNSDAWCDLGDTWIEEDIKGALNCYEEAYTANPHDPRSFVRYLETRMCIDKNIDVLTLLYPNLMDNISACLGNARVQVYLPWAYYDLGRLYLFLYKPFESLAALAKAIHLSERVKPVEDALASITRLQVAVGESIPELEWIRRFLLVGLVAKLLLLRKIKEKKAQQEKRTFTSQEIKDIEQSEKRAREIVERDFRKAGLATAELPEFKPHVIVVAGGCDPRMQKEMDEYKGVLHEAFSCFNGTIISGGTKEGISGIVGDLPKPRHGSLLKIAYLPEEPYLPDDAREHDGYHIIRTPRMGFSPLDPLQTWIDLLTNGIMPWDVRLLGINGGELAAFEYQIALVAGATVGIVEHSGRAASDLLPDIDWWSRGNLVKLPRDPMSIRAFANPGGLCFSEQEREMLGKAVHEQYRKLQTGKPSDPSLQPWEKLDPSLKISYIEQATYAREILCAEGYDLKEKKSAEIPKITFSDSEIDRMAEMEHGRFLIERLRQGWKYGAKKDVANKISPTLVPWGELDEENRKKDRDAVRGWPEIFAIAGYEIVKLA